MDSAVRERRYAALEAQLERARRAGRPLIITRLQPTTAATGAASPESAAAAAATTTAALSPAAQATAVQHHHCFVGDPSLLEALAMEVLAPGALIGMPPDPAAPTKPAALTAAAAVAPEGPGAAAAPSPSKAAPAGGAASAQAAAKEAGAGEGSNLERPEESVPLLLRLIQNAPPKTKKKEVGRWTGLEGGEGGGKTLLCLCGVGEGEGLAALFLGGSPG